VYQVNEIFYSLQGEGVRAGTANVFVRFAACNLQCNVVEHGFDCDTDFTSGEEMDARDILQRAEELWEGKLGRTQPCVIFTGGEPGLQLDDNLCGMFARWYKAVETNGTKQLPDALDWISVSPKTAEHTLRVVGENRFKVSELRYVRDVGQALPKPKLTASYRCISPAFTADGTVKQETMEHCFNMVTANPDWRLSMQLHKFWRCR